MGPFTLSCWDNTARCATDTHTYTHTRLVFPANQSNHRELRANLLVSLSKLFPVNQYHMDAKANNARTQTGWGVSALRAISSDDHSFHLHLNSILSSWFHVPALWLADDQSRWYPAYRPKSAERGSSSPANLNEDKLSNTDEDKWTDRFWVLTKASSQMCAKPLSVEKYQHITQGKVNLKTSHVTKVVVLEAPFAVSIKARICSPFLSQLSINGTRTELRHRGWLTFPGYWDSTRAGIGYFHTHFCCTIVLKIFYKSRWNGCHLMIWLPDAVPLCDSTHSCCNIPLC